MTRGILGQLGALVLFLLPGAAATSANVITWTGAGDGTTWTQAANWDLGREPTTTDDVVIPDVPGTSVIVITSNAGAGSLTCAEDLRLTGGNFYVYDDGTIDADFEFLGGKVFGDNHTNTLTVNGLFRWNCSTTQELSTITLVAAGSVELSGAGWKSLYGSTLVIDCPGTIAGGGISFSGYPLQLGPDADLHVLTSGVQFSGSAGTSVEGTLVLDAGVSATMSNMNIAASGIVQVSDGGTLTMSYANSITSSGTIDLGDDAVLSAPITLNGTANVTGTGTLRITASSYFNGTHQIDAGVDLPVGTNVYVTIYGATTVNGSFTMASGVYVNGTTGASLTLNGPATMNGGTMNVDPAIANGPVTVAGNWGIGYVFEHRGRLDWTGGSIGIWGSYTLRTAAGGEFHAYVNGGSMYRIGSGGVATYDNQGLFVLEPGISVSTGYVTVQNAGTMQIGAGSALTVGQMLSSSGTIDLADNAVLSGALTLNGTANVTGTGTLRITASSYFNGTHQIDPIVDLPVGTNVYVNIYGATTINGSFTMASGTYVTSNGGPGTVTFNGPVIFYGGLVDANPAIANGPVTVAGNLGVGQLFEHRARLDWIAGNIAIWYGYTLRTAATGEFHAHLTDGLLSHTGSAGVSLYDNEGLCVIEPGASLTTGNAMHFLSSGPLEIGAATLTIHVGTISGDVSIAADGLLKVDSNDAGLAFDGHANITGAGTLRPILSVCNFNGTHDIGVPVEQAGGNVYVNTGTTTFNAPYNHTAGWFGATNGGTAILNGDLTWYGAHLGGDGTIILNGNTTADFVGHCNLPEQGWCWLFGNLINHGVFTQTGWLRVCSSGVFLNVPVGEPGDPDYLPGEHRLYGCVTGCTYGCGGYSNHGLTYVSANSVITLSLPESDRENGGRSRSDGAYVQTSGATVLDGATLTADGGVDLQGGTFYGNGVVEADVISTCSFAPGLSPGQISITGSYTQNAPGGLAIEIAGPNPGTDYDVLAISDSATLAGGLTVTLAPAYDPLPGATFDILTAAAPSNAISGVFNPVSLPPPSITKRWDLTYTEHAVRLRVFRIGDMNCDSLISYGDINPFVLALNNRSAYESTYPDCSYLNADCNSDGFVSYGDINPFVVLLSGQ